MRRRIHNRANLRTARPRAQLRQGRTDWYRITNLADSTEVYIYDEIGYWGTSAADFVRDIQAITANRIDLRLNSPGGEVFDGIAIYNALRSHQAEVTVYVDSLAASIASVIAQAGDRIVMRRGAQMMIHDGLMLCIGNAQDMREAADLLDRQSDNIAGIYTARAGGTVDEWRERMRAETWYTADEAVAAGLADEVDDDPGTDPTAPVNSWDLSIFSYRGRGHAPAPDLPPAGTAVDPQPAPARPRAAASPPAPAPAPPAAAPPQPPATDTDMEWTDDLAAAFLDALRPPDESDLAAAFRAALHPEPEGEPEIPVIDPTEFYNAILEATS